MSQSDRRRALSSFRRPPEHVTEWLRGSREPTLLDEDPAWRQLADLMEPKDPETIGRLEAWAAKLSRSAMLTRAERGALDRMQKPERHFALAVDCPWCDAKENEACVGVKNDRLKKPHDERCERFFVLAGAEASPEAREVVRNSRLEGSSLVTRGGWLAQGVFAEVRMLVGSVGGRWSHGGTFLFPAGATAEERVEELLRSRVEISSIEGEPGEIVDPLNIPAKKLAGVAAEFAIRLILGEKANVGVDALSRVRVSGETAPDVSNPISVAAHGFYRGYIAGQDAASLLRASVLDLLDVVEREERGEAEDGEVADALERAANVVELLVE